jgi:hypothetical protein
MIRLYAKEVGETLRGILENGPEDGKAGIEIGSDFSESAEAKLDDIFQD